MIGSIRMRLTLAYTAALLTTMAAFAGALWWARRDALLADLQREVAVHADQAIRVLIQAKSLGQPVFVRDTSRAGGRVLNPTVRFALETIPGYLLVLDPQGQALFASPNVRTLSYRDFNIFNDAALLLSDTQPSALVPLRDSALVARQDDELILRRRPVEEVDPLVAEIVAGTSTRQLRAAPEELVEVGAVVVPLLVLCSIGLAWLIAGRSLRPIDQIIDEVAAITDGRSLHRRLLGSGDGESESEDEVGRLVSTLNAMMGRLESSFAALRRFTADASHELKTPLAVLRADVERAMNVRVAEHERLVALEEALQEVARMSDLVDSLLTLARADEGRFDLYREPVALEPLVREVYETAQILGEDGGLSVMLPVVEEATILGDRMRLRQLMLNLVTNALKYTPRGGTVEISLSRRLDAVTFTVRDTGIGIAAADLPHVFDRFFRADRARTRTERSGAGLGLAIAQWIAQAHGGTLSATSRLGRGSTFTASFPTGGPISAHTAEHLAVLATRSAALVEAEPAAGGERRAESRATEGATG